MKVLTKKVLKVRDFKERGETPRRAPQPSRESPGVADYGPERSRARSKACGPVDYQGTGEGAAMKSILAAPSHAWDPPLDYYTMTYKLFIMSGTEESITEESMKALKEDIEKLTSRCEQLMDLANKLLKKDGEISQNSQISENIKNNLPTPIKPWGFEFGKSFEWDRYFNEANRLIQEKEKQDALRKQLEELEKERKIIESQIIPLVPPSFHGIKIKLSNNQKWIIVNGETVLSD